MNDQKELCRQVQLDPRPENWNRAQQEHVGLCPGCRSFLSSLGALGERLLGLESTRETMPDNLRARLLGGLEEAAAPTPRVIQGRPARRPESAASRWLVPLAMAACLVLGIMLEKQFDFGAPGLPDKVAEAPASFGAYIDDVTHDHFLLERIGRPLEVEMAAAQPLSDWLSHSLAFDFALPAETGSLQLEGGRVWHTVGRLSAMAAYRAPDGSRVVLFAIPAENLEASGAECRNIAGKQVFCGESWGHEARVWVEGDLAIALTAPQGHIPEGWEQVFLAGR